MKVSDLYEHSVSTLIQACEVARIQPICSEDGEIIRIIVDYTPNKLLPLHKLDSIKRSEVKITPKELASGLSKFTTEIQKIMNQSVQRAILESEEQ